MNYLDRFEKFKPYLEYELYTVQVWQWAVLLLLVALAYFVGRWTAALLIKIAKPAAGRTKTRFDDLAFDLIAPPLRWIAAVVLFSFAAELLQLPDEAEVNLAHIEKLLLLLFSTWFVFRLVDALGKWAYDYLANRNMASATGILPMARRGVKVAVGLLVFLSILQNFGVNVTALLAGLGVGGLAIALAGQKTFENLFGGISVILDQPVRVGDFCKFGDQFGTLEYIGLRSTRVRTLDRTIVTIPNADFAEMNLENFSQRDKIWLYTTIGVRYETTPDQLRYLLVELRKILYAHPKVDPEPARVRFVKFNAYSLDLEVFAYVQTSDWNEFLGIREDIYLRMMNVIEQSGTEIAFPSQTTYLEPASATDEDRSKDVAAQVQAWRDNNELYVPEFPEETIAELDDTLPFPDEGAPESEKQAG